MQPPPPSPLERLFLPVAERAGVRLFVKRDDRYTLAPGTALQGNKVRKLLPVLTEAAAEPQRLHYTFGGSHSNHLAAVATAVDRFGLRAVAFVRGEDATSPQLDYCRECGLDLIRISRGEYRRRDDNAWLGEQRKALARKYVLPVADVHRLPEGGTTWEGMIACGDVLRETTAQLSRTPDFFCLSAGTGGTAAGVLHAADPATRVEVFPALKGNWLAAAIQQYLYPTASKNWTVIPDYVFGGYARWPAAWTRTGPGLQTLADTGVAGLPALEPVYTAKLFAGVLDRLAKGVYPPESSVVVLHSGGIY